MLAIGLRKLRDDDVASLVEEVLIPRFMAEPISPVAGGLLQEIVADNAHHGLVDLALEEAHRWLVHNQETFSDVVGERAPWWAPDRLNDARHHAAAPRGGPLGRRHPARPAAPRPAGAGQPAAPARPRPAQRPGDPGARRAAQDPGPRAAADGRDRDVAVERLPQGAARGARGRDGSAARRGRRASWSPSASGSAATTRCARGWTRWGADFAVWAVGRYGDELTAVITAHDRALGRRGGGPQDRAARRPRPAVHPDQRHHRRRPRRRGHPRGLAGCSRRSRAWTTCPSATSRSGSVSSSSWPT